MKFACKLMDLKIIITVRKDHTWYVPTDKWTLVKDYGIPMIQLTNPMKLKRKEGRPKCGYFSPT